MTNSESTNADTESEAHRTGKIEKIHNAHPSSTQQHGKNIRDNEWTTSKQPSLSTTEGNFAQIIRAKGNPKSEEFTKQVNYLTMENSNYLKAGYPSNPNSYYGWLPGLNSVRFPAFIYPQSFVGFAPTLAWMKTNTSSEGQPTNIEKIDRWLSGKKDTIPSMASPSVKYIIDTDNSDKLSCTSEATKDPSGSAKSSNSDEDEGLVLDERETVKRKRQKESAKLQTDCVKPRCEQRSSVIQPNISIQPKPSVIIRHSQNASSSTEQEENRPAKRGRASTRQIEKTEQYWDRRKKNNVSAKKSRDARRQREAVMNQRSSMLETENLRLRAELATLRDENARLKMELGKLKSPT
ncbi:transcription factor VBP-like [Dendronephthya gigantea]|uniref:transcription factor VBP-like n=1 Tax=Dendronephthya gigantea TaxID=151771 RepID=UPI00106ADB0C|nr:transcription factor VBP-like [Dendronephthya gigantea]